MLQVKDLKRRGISEILLYVANPDWLEDRLVPKGKTVLESLNPDDLARLRRYTGNKIKNIQAQRDQLIDRINEELFEGVEWSQEPANNYYELLKTIFSKRILNRERQTHLTRLEKKVREEAPEIAEVDIPLMESVYNFREEINPSWIQKLKDNKINLRVHIPRGGPKGLVYLQTKDKTADRLANRLAKEVVLEERVTAEHDITPETDAVFVGDIAGFRYVTLWGLPISNGANIFHNPERTNHGSVLERLIYESRPYRSLVPERNEDTGVLDFEERFKNCYTDQEERIFAIHSHLILRPAQGLQLPHYENHSGIETVSGHFEDLYNAVEDEIGRRAHMLFEHRQENKGRFLEDENYSESEEARKSLYKERVHDFLLTVTPYKQAA